MEAVLAIHGALLQAALLGFSQLRLWAPRIGLFLAYQASPNLSRGVNHVATPLLVIS